MRSQCCVAYHIKTILFRFIVGLKIISTAIVHMFFTRTYKEILPFPVGMISSSILYTLSPTITNTSRTRYATNLVSAPPSARKSHEPQIWCSTYVKSQMLDASEVVKLATSLYHNQQIPSTYTWVHASHPAPNPHRRQRSSRRSYIRAVLWSARLQRRTSASMMASSPWLCVNSCWVCS
jgi:hypothetical protein